MGSEKCVHDPEKISKVCNDPAGIHVSLTKKTIARFERDMQQIQPKMPSFDGFQRDTQPNVRLNRGFHMTHDQINGVTCATNITNKFDQLLILPTEGLTMKSQSPVVVVKLPYHKCQKFVQKSPLASKIYPNEVFDSMVRDEIRRKRLP